MNKRKRYLGHTRPISTTSQVSNGGDYVIEISHSLEPEGVTECGAESLEECEVQFNHTQVEVYVYRYRLDDHTGRKWKDLVDTRRTVFIGRSDGGILGAVSGYNHETERDYYKTDLTPMEAHISVMNFANKYLKAK